jgi:hypothetical protein
MTHNKQDEFTSDCVQSQREKISQVNLKRRYKVLACWKAIFLLPVILTACLFPGRSLAQVTTATLYGNVSDTTAAVIGGATVTITNLETNISTTQTTNSVGEFRFELIPVGTYSVAVSAAGFKKFLQTAVPLSVNQEQRLDIPLATGTTEESVTVSSELPQLDLESATVERTLETKEIDNLPILNRNIYNLLTLVPGVQANTVGGNTLGYNQEVLQMNGGTTSNNNGTVSYYLDGGLNMTADRNTGNDMPNPEALAEFNVQASNYNATYGRMSSGVVTALTKSGTNSFHGSAYEFNRNTDFDASNPANQGGGVGIVHRNMYGVTAGGPIRRDKTFFFGEFGGVRQIQPFTFSGSTLPTFSGGTTGNGEAAGDFSQFLPAGAPATAACGGSATSFVVCNPATKKPYTADGVHASNIITGTLDPTAANIMKYLKGFETTTLNGLPSYVGQEAEPYNTYEFMGKIDHQLSTNQRLEGTYFYVNGYRQIPAGTPSVPWVAQSQIWSQHQFNLNDTWTISPSKINQTWFTFTRILGGRQNITNLGQARRQSLANLGSNINVQGPASLSQITVSGYFTLANTIDGPEAGTDFYSVRDMFIINKGKHALTLGGEASLNKDQISSDLNNYGVFGFSSSTTARSGNALSDFVLGDLATQTQDAPVDALDDSFFYSIFAQDDWRVLSNLTLNLGVRWDLQTAPTDPQNKESTFVAGEQSTVNPLMPPGVLVVGDKGVGRGTISNSYNHFSPRVGLAWDPFGKGKTSVRASGGIFWGGISGNEWSATSNYYPFSLRYTFPIPGTLTNPYLNSPSPFPYIYTPGAVKAIVTGGSVEGVVPNFHWPYTYQLTASIQQQLTRGTAVSVAYVGSLGRDISLSTDANYPVFNTTTPTANTSTTVLGRRPIDTGVLGQILAVYSNQTSNYNALQLTFSQRVIAGISFNGFYTWSKSLDSDVLNSSTAPEDYNNPKIEKGPDDYDQRQSFAMSAVWEPNYIHNGSRVAPGVLNGWHVSTVISAHSGLPFNITTGSDNNNDGNTTDRPVLLGNPWITNTNRSSRASLVKEFYNPSYVTGSAPTTQTFCGYSTKAPTDCVGVGPGGSDGSMERNQLYGPGFVDVDASLFRDFTIYESVKLQARAEASNVLNLVNLGNPNATLSSATAGTITTVATGSNMRQIQLGLRLTF